MKCAYCHNEHGIIGDVVCPVKALPYGLIYEGRMEPAFTLGIDIFVVRYERDKPTKDEEMKREYLVDKMRSESAHTWQRGKKH